MALKALLPIVRKPYTQRTRQRDEPTGQTESGATTIGVLWLRACCMHAIIELLHARGACSQQVRCGGF